MVYIEKGGWVPRILILKRTEGGWWVISGQRRVLAHQKLYKTYIEAEVVDITLEEAKIMAETTNEGKKPYWLDSYENWETFLNENPDWTIRGLADRLGKPKSLVHRAGQITSLLNSASRTLIRESLNSQKPLFFDGDVPNGDTDPENKGKSWQLNEGTVRQLIPLLTDREIPEAQALTEKAVKIILEHRMTGPQVSQMVARINSGKSPADSQQPAVKAPSPKAVPIKVPAQTETEPKTATHSAASPAPSAATPKASGDGQMGTAVPSSSLGTGTTKASASAGGLSTGETMLWETLAGISVITQIKSKIKKGQRPTVGEFFLLAGHYLKKPFEWLAKHGIKGFFHGIHWIWKTLIESLKVVGIYPYLKAAFFLIAFVLAGWCVWDGYHNGFWHPVKVVGTKLHIPFLKPESAPPETEKPMQPPTSPINKVAHHSVTTRPVASTPISQTVAWSADQESKTDLEKEFAALFKNTVIKPFLFEPNILDGAIANQRLQDLDDPDKYTMRRGQEADKVLNVALTSTNLTIFFKSSDIFSGITGGSNKSSFYWQDVKAIHLNFIDSEKPKYQMTVIADGEKEPFTIQCAGGNDLKHIASALEFWIKAAQGQYAPLTGMPYLNQGLLLNNEGEVTTLWADSPATHAGVQLGDMIWSVEKNGHDQLKARDAEGQLTALSPGPHSIYLVSPRDRDKAKILMNQTNSDVFNPNRRALKLIVP